MTRYSSLADARRAYFDACFTPLALAGGLELPLLSTWLRQQGFEPEDGPVMRLMDMLTS